MIRRIAFTSGLVLGSGICAFTLGAVLIFLFTGQVVAISASKEQGIKVNLFDMHTLQETPASLAKEGGI
ncbi:MAG: hypothetical protein JXA89_19625 [Anaerolineae bacterium]|nr:hypothetical protein [Anaerolineae bacterium]